MEIDFWKGFEIVGWILSIGVAWGITKAQNGDLRRDVNKLQEWKETHERDVSSYRSKYDQDIKVLTVANARLEEKFEMIVSMLRDIRNEVSKMRP